MLTVMSAHVRHVRNQLFPAFLCREPSQAMSTSISWTQITNLLQASPLWSVATQLQWLEKVALVGYPIIFRYTHVHYQLCDRLLL